MHAAQKRQDSLIRPRRRIPSSHPIMVMRKIEVAAHVYRTEGSEMPTITNGDRMLIIDRRLFKDDNTRLFVGVVEDYDTAPLRVRGFPFHLNPYEVSGAERHGEERVRIVSMTAGEPIYLLPRGL